MSDTRDLLFAASPASGPPWVLLFGDEGTATPAAADYTLAGSFAPLSVSALARNVDHFDLAGSFAALGLVASAEATEPPPVEVPPDVRDLLFADLPASGPPWTLLFGTEPIPEPPPAIQDLLFTDPPVTGPPWVLIFGGGADVVVPPPIDLDYTLAGSFARLTVSALARNVDHFDLAGSFAPLTAAVQARNVAPYAVAGSFAPLTCTAVAAYDNRLTRYLDVVATAPQQPAHSPRPQQTSGWGTSLSQRGGQVQPWQLAVTGRIAPDLVHTQATRLQPDYAAPWTPTDARRISQTASNQPADPRRISRVAAYQWAAHIRREVMQRLQTGLVRSHPHTTGKWALAKPLRHDRTTLAGASRYRVGRQADVMPWQRGQIPHTGREVIVVVLPPTGCYTPSGDLLFSFPWDGSPNIIFQCGNYVPAREPVVVPLLRIYVTINTLTLRRVDGDIAIPTYTYSMSLDTDSWTWSWSASIPAAALALVQPGSNGDPIEIEAMVNGVPYRLLAEGIGSQRQFAQGRISVQGRGTAAMLDAPYAPVLNHGNSAPRTAQQLMTDVLTVNGVGIGWALDWGLTDWLVPGNTWTHQGAYIGAILDIAQAAGAYVQPHNTAPTLRILPRYPAAPWHWGTIVADFELPSAVVAVEGIDWLRRPSYNRVHVSGTSNGVLGEVTRAGTAGDSVAPMLTHPLITHADAARQRGLAVLSDTGTQARVTLKLPVLADTGLITPGKFVRYLDGTTPRLGLVRGTALDWSSPKLRQTISVETHTV